MDENVEYGFGTAIFVLDYTSEKISPADADRTFGEVTKENFWRMWPDVKKWADELWHVLEDERGDQARPALDEELDDVGGGG
jgi:hypothetical protein